MVAVALYARVSSEKQAQANTIESQIAALESRISVDGYALLHDLKFTDNGYSGSNLVRPALENLRDKIANGEVDKVYVHSPDRLSRKYAHQIILVEEFQKYGVEIIFLNHQITDSPESNLLLQMQGMIAEYERSKIMERYRRGKIHAAKKGCVNILGGAPYGYDYINKQTAGGQARYEINLEKAEVVRKIFSWFVHERISLCEVRRRLEKLQIKSPKGKERWDRSVIWGVLKNPAYIGKAAFGKTKIGKKLSRARPIRNAPEQSKWNYSVYDMEEKNWIYIPVPAIVDEALFVIAQEQLEDNKKASKARLNKKAMHLLQGLVVCKKCGYSYCAKGPTNKIYSTKIKYQYYRCIGNDAYRFGGNKLCDNKQIRTDILETAVWEEVKYLLRDPNRILSEYQKRITDLEKTPLDPARNSLEKQSQKLKQGISRLIDSYTNGHLDKDEFEPRIKAMKQSIKIIEDQKKKIFDQQDLKKDLILVITNLEHFTSRIESNLEDLDWHAKRDIIRALVKRVEINIEEVNIVFRIRELPHTPTRNDGLEKNQSSSQHCCGRSERYVCECAARN